MEYPNEGRVESALRQLATEIGDDTADPFRVALLKVHGGQPPRYTVVVVSPKQMLLCDRLGAVVGRSFSVGVRSFLLTVPEASKLILKYGGAPSGSFGALSEERSTQSSCNAEAVARNTSRTLSSPTGCVRSSSTPGAARRTVMMSGSLHGTLPCSQHHRLSEPSQLVRQCRWTRPTTGTAIALGVCRLQT